MSLSSPVIEPASEPSPARHTLANLSPSYFGIVMATGIVSLAAHFLSKGWVANVLFGLNLGFYVLLCLLTTWRALRHSRLFFADMTDHLRGPGFFTTVAGTSVLGAQCLILAQSTPAAFILWGVAVVLWLLLTYAIFAALTLKSSKPALDRGINGGWLLAVVATQSLAVLSALLAPYVGQPYKLEMNFFALSMWLWGGMLYIWMMSLIFYRYTFFVFSPSDLVPPYWINMGAMAISTLAGSLLIRNAPDAPYLASLLPFLKGFTIFYWATGTWWIPMLLLLGVWRYVYKRFPLRYDPMYWGAVFPLGMYGASTFQMNKAMSFGFLDFVPVVFLYVALFAWTLAFLGLLYELGQGIIGHRLSTRR
jgi:tellurite resistance protein TehA-like permease